ncbi:carboxylating nicotinate-nucleotide diphosphorylase [Nocardioidaceae bacterium]|nr:carboxylating nicotinate-nucleotide diphosphorylase [Nocardioidaceae bacterium]
MSSAPRELARSPLGDVPPGLVAELEGMGLDAAEVHAVVGRAYAEDCPTEDVTSWPTLPLGDAAGDLVARADGVVAGLAVAELAFRYALGPAVTVERGARDGDRVRRGQVLLTATGDVGLLLTAERTALNLLCHLSGVATATAAWEEAMAGTGCRVRDTRKTTPGLRHLEKYAVRAGGGLNHRTSLSDQGLVKDNHVLACGGVVPAYEAVVTAHPGLPVQVEVTTLEQLEELLEVGAPDILLDNMSLEQMTEAVTRTDGRARLEASGGLTLERAVAVARTGVDTIAVGALTHSAPVLDVAMDLRPGS